MRLKPLKRIVKIELKSLILNAGGMLNTCKSNGLIPSG